MQLDTNDKKQTTNFRKFLQQELMKRCERNPSYSLRAFAKSLRLSHATLSHILAGRRPLTNKMIQRIGLTLGLGPQEVALFQSPTRSQAQNMAPNNYHELTIDTFTAISEWYHDAILELTHLKNFKADTKWIAKSLGITINEVNMAAERLARLELLEIKGKKWTDLSQNNSTSLDPDFTSVALRKYQKKILELSLKALEEVPKVKREHASNMLAFQKSDLEEVRKRIHRFRWSLTKFIQRKEAKPDEVYQLALSFFPITKDKIQGGF
ncbi:MAG: TIGR02147 family protein [Bdellovibrionales bacterium]